MQHGNLFPKQAPLHPVKGFPAELAGPFATFWLAYPHRVPNPRAVAAVEFARVVRDGATPAQLISAATAYAAEIKRLGTANDFIVHARTFLRQGRWQDYLASPVDREPAAPVPPAHELWPELQGDMTESAFRSWILHCDVVERTAASLVLAAPSHFVASRIREDFVPLMQRVLGCTVTVTVEPAR